MRVTLRRAIVVCGCVLAGGGALSAAPDASPTPSGLPGPAGCRGSQLRITVEMTNEWMLHENVVYIVTNHGPASCVLTGFPDVAAYHDTTGHPTPPTRVHVAITNQGTARAVPLAPGARAGFVISNQVDTNRATPCPRTEFVITLPDQARHITIPSERSLPVCRPEPFQGAYAVTPIERFSQIPHPAPKD